MNNKRTAHILCVTLVAIFVISAVSANITPLAAALTTTEYQSSTGIPDGRGPCNDNDSDDIVSLDINMVFASIQDEINQLRLIKSKKDSISADITQKIATVGKKLNSTRK